jgi:amidase
MTKVVVRMAVLGCLLASAISAIASVGGGNSEFAGRWEVTTTYPGGSFVAGLDLLSAHEGIYEGKSGYLVPDSYWYHYAGDLQKDGLHLKILGADGKSEIGSLLLKINKGALTGSGVLHGVAITTSGRRPLKRPPNAPRVHDFAPQIFYRGFSGANPPALHIFPGDTVRTQTVDAAGGGINASQHTLPGNPQTGPFYVEGAMIGDTIAVHFSKIRPNRDTAFQYRGGLDPGVLPPGYHQEPPATGWSDIWNLDRAHGTATPANPTEKLKDLVVKLTPMLGCVAVAPYWNQAITTADLGPFGGNLDYNQVKEGVTVHLPVYQAGALLTVGDGHAVQGDGEITGQGLETSMDVEFSVELIPTQLLDQVWAEDQDDIMVSGVGGSLTEALQVATAGLSNWLKSYYRLDAAEIATVLANSIHYDVAEVVDPRVHMVAKIHKSVLAQLPKPEPPTSVFCQAGWGCAPN